MTSRRSPIPAVWIRALAALVGVVAGLGQPPATWAQSAATPPAAPAPAAPAPAAPAPAAGGATPAGGAATTAGAAGAAPTSAADPATGGAAPVSANDPGAYRVRLQSLDKNVNELKEQVFRTKARLNLLKEAVLGGVIGASRAVIRHKNDMGSSYRLIKAVYALDGVQIFGRTDDSGRLAEMTDFDVYNGAIQPGSHTLTVVLQYQGHGFGVFSYLKNYKFNVKASHTFVAGEGKATSIMVVGFEKGNITTSFEERPAVEFRVNLLSEGGASVGGDAK